MATKKSQVQVDRRDDSADELTFDPSARRIVMWADVVAILKATGVEVDGDRTRHVSERYVVEYPGLLVPSGRVALVKAGSRQAVAVIDPDLRYVGKARSGANGAGQGEEE